LDARYPRARRGIVLMLLAVSVFGCVDTISKILVAHYPAPYIVWMRSVLQTVLMVALFAPRMGLRLVRSSRPGLQILRGVVLNASAVVFVVSLGRMPIAEAASIMFLAPVIVALAAGPLLGERLHPRTWIALGCGFSGVLLIIKPGSAVFTWVALLPLVCAFSVAALPTQPLHAALLAALGVLSAVGHFLLIKAHDLAPASTLAPFSYVQLLMVLAMGWLMFGELPDGLAFAGMALVAAAGLTVILLNRPRGTD